jgi:hypothetical protein
MARSQKTTVTVQTSSISEIKISWDETEANTFLKTKKWEMLFAGVAHKDELGFNAKPIFVLGKLK